MSVKKSQLARETAASLRLPTTLKRKGADQSNAVPPPEHLATSSHV